jgi:colanic acid/amylovoran biosynthesis protein
MMNILLLEQPTRNRGDESAHRGLVEMLLSTYPDSTIYSPYYGNTQEEIEAMRVKSERVIYINLISKLNKWSPHRIVKLLMMLRLPILIYCIPFMWKYVRLIRQADIVVGAPGGIEMGGFMGWFHIGLFWMVKFEKKPCFYFGRSIGPFSEDTYFKKLFRNYCLSLFKYFSFLSLRDSRSQKVADEMGINYVPTIDSAFLRSISSPIPEEVLSFINQHQYIVFVPNALAWHHNYSNNYTVADFTSFWTRVLDSLLSAYPDKKVIMLPQTTFVPWIHDGYPFFKEIAKNCMCPSHVYVLSDQYGSDVQQGIIRDAEFLIGARYHSIIFSINQNVPFISLSYEHKMTGVLQILGKLDCEVDIDAFFRGHTIHTVDVKSLINQILLMAKHLQKDEQARVKAQAIALEGFEEFKQAVNRVKLSC